MPDRNTVVSFFEYQDKESGYIILHEYNYYGQHRITVANHSTSSQWNGYVVPAELIFHVGGHNQFGILAFTDYYGERVIRFNPLEMLNENRS